MKRKLFVALGLAFLMVLTLTCAVGCVEDVGEHTHTWATEWSHNETEHWHACTGEGCTEKNDVAAHLGGTATCKTKAVCEVCGGEYGELNVENHESAEFTYTANNDGTHKKAYKCCGVVVVENETCSGGTATCKTKAKCELCDGEHGELNAENHESTEFTYTANNDGTHKKVYACCGTVAAENEECSGGTATCMKKAECEHCGAAYGELSTEHGWATEWSHDETNHWYACTVEGCIAKKDEAAHLGGKATCKTEATCTACGTAYGDLDAENHESTEFTYTANNDGTHKKAHECCGAVENANETCSGGTATCVAKAVCALCGEEYGALSSKHAYADGLDTSDDEYDYKKCICGELDLENGFRKIVNADNQQLVMTSETIALNLEGVSAYDAVKSITLDEANLGTNVNALELGSIKTDVKQHGAKVIKIVVTDADGLDHEIIVNVILVTKVIATDADLNVVFNEKSLAPSEARINVYGYYVLANDIVYTGNRHYAEFYGTFDGNGKTISTSDMLNGLFCYIKSGCVIKDLTIKATISPAYNYRTVLANGCVSATFINVGVIYEGGADTSELNDGGFLFRELSENSKFINLTVSATGKKIGSLFGQKLINTTFTDCVVYADEVNCVAGMADGTNRVEFADVEGLEHKHIEVKEIALWQDTPSLDYGDMFNGKTVAEITCGNYSLGNSLTALSIPEGLKADKQNHGSTVICVKFASGAKAYLPVILVTAEIKTESDFVGALTITSKDDAVKFGYYKLADNLVWGRNVNGTGDFWNPEASAELGFRGTFDGNGHTVTMADGLSVYNGGFFGLIGKGAVIKNVTFTVSSMTAYAHAVFGSQGHNATVQDVTINFKANGAPTNTAGGVFFARFSGTITYKNVTVNAAGQDLQTIFGNTLGSNVPNCENVVVNAKSLVAIGYGSYSGAPITTLKGFTFNKTETLE